MTYFLRNNKNHTIFSLDFWTKTDYETAHNDKHRYHEISASVDIRNYSKFLIDNVGRAGEIVDIFDTLSEYRGWLWESHYMGRQNKGSDEEGKLIQQEISIDLQKVAKLFDLYYVTD